jgi:hypothetical protein
VRIAYAKHYAAKIKIIYVDTVTSIIAGAADVAKPGQLGIIVKIYSYLGYEAVTGAGIVFFTVVVA